MRPTEHGQVVQEVVLLIDKGKGARLPTLGKLATNHLCSWKDYLAIVANLLSLMIGIAIVFEPGFAAYWGQMKQFVWIGLYLTIMAWCAQLSLRRLFLMSSVNSQASTFAGWPELSYDIPVIEHTTAMTIQPGWGIIVVLALYPAILFGSLLWRVLVRPLAPVGEGFGLVSLMASVDKRYLQLLEGASLSGKLKRPVFVGLRVDGGEAGSETTTMKKITCLLGTQELSSGLLKKRTMYR